MPAQHGPYLVNITLGVTVATLNWKKFRTCEAARNDVYTYEWVLISVSRKNDILGRVLTRRPIYVDVLPFRNNDLQALEHAKQHRNPTCSK